MLAYNNTNSDYNKVRIFYSLVSLYLLQADISSQQIEERNGVNEAHQ